MSRIEQALQRAGGIAIDVDDRDMSGQSAGPVRSALDDYPREVAEARSLRKPSAVVTPKLGAVVARDTGSLGGAIGRSADARLVSAADACPMLVEQYRRLAATLYQGQARGGLKNLMVSSALPREGKTLTVTNLGLTLSQSYRQKVLLIDADLRSPSLHEHFGLANDQGLSDYLRNPATDLAIAEISPLLSVIPAGSVDRNPLAGLVSERMKAVVDKVGARFDWVLLDTPPIGLLPDANLLASLADGVVFVIAASSSPYRVVQQAIAAVGMERILGVVLNKAAASNLPSSTYYRDYSPRSEG